MQRYFLHRDTYLCFADTGAVALDLVQDRYLGFDPEQATGLLSLIQDTTAAISGSENIEEFAAVLRGEGLITTEPSAGKHFVPISLPMPEETLVEPDLLEKETITPRDVLFFVAAVVSAAVSMRVYSLHRTIQKLQACNSRRRAQPGAVDLEAVRRILRKFFRLRIFTYKNAEQCLYDSLVLRHFLDRHGVQATFVIGVRVNPFAAHSWLQLGHKPGGALEEHYVLNSTPGEIQYFSPIIVV